MNKPLCKLHHKHNTLEVFRKQEIELRIRRKYSLSDELAILRQKDSKPEEYNEYFQFVEAVKTSVNEDIARCIAEDY